MFFFFPPSNPKFPQQSASLFRAAVVYERVVFCSRDDNNSIFLVSTEVSSRKSVDSVPAIELKPHRMIRLANGIGGVLFSAQTPYNDVWDRRQQRGKPSFCTHHSQ